MKFPLLFLPVLLLSTFVLSAHLGSASAQRQDGCVIIPLAESTATTGEEMQSEFSIDSPGRYILQLIHEPDAVKAGLAATASVNAVDLGGETSRDYWIKDGIVTSFKIPVHLVEPGAQTISLSCSVRPSYVRLIPAIYLSSRIKVGSQEYYEEWIKMHESPEKQAAMQWYQEAKFGMFIHWGVYSQAAGSWQGIKIEDSGFKGPKVAEWLMYTFQISRDDYRELAQSFSPEQSFAQTIASLARQTGMRYMVITAKHHDGFALFNSACSEWDIADASPYDGDLIKELYEACLAEGVGFGVYYSHGHDWMDGCDADFANVQARQSAYDVPTRPQGKNRWDPSSIDYNDYLEQKAYPQVRELVEMMPELKLIWFDGEGDITEPQALRFYKMIYDLNPSIIVNRRVGFEYGDYMDAGDNKTPKAGELAPKYFETCGTANHSWGFKAHDHNWKPPAQLLLNFVDIISKGGNYLLNIGPDGKGDVPEPCRQGFLEMGKWVHKHGEAVYGTHRWSSFTEQNDTGEYWFSQKGDKLYVMSITPAGEQVQIQSLNQAAAQIQSLRLLGDSSALSWEQGEEGLMIDTSSLQTLTNGYVIEVVLAE